MIRRACPAIFLLVGCGTDPPPIAQLTLASRYEVVGVARLFPDGLTVGRQRPFSFVLEDLQSSGGRAVGVAKGSVPSLPASLSGTFEADEGQLRLGPGDGALTSTVSERIVALGGIAEDALPKDGIAQEISGFINSTFGVMLSEGRLLAIADYDGRPPTPDKSKITLTPMGLGKYLAQGTAGAVASGAAIEIRRHQLDMSDTTNDNFLAREGGAFEQEIDGLPGDIVLLSARSAGRSSAAIVFELE
jgi:hypothetical protein